MKVCEACGSVQRKNLSYEKAFKIGACLCGYDDGVWPDTEEFIDDEYTDDGYDRDENSDYGDLMEDDYEEVA
jgi:hypothetical protein